MNAFADELGNLLLVGIVGFLVLSALYHALVVLSRGPAPTSEDRPETVAHGYNHAPRSGRISHSDPMFWVGHGGSVQRWD